VNSEISLSLLSSTMKTALVIVDVQNDFLPARNGRKDGALAVPEGNDILPLINDLLDRGKWEWDVVIATQVSLVISSLITGLSSPSAYLLRFAVPQ
jgi:hypothetical protein